MCEILFPEESYKIIGAAMDVHKHLGHGFLEPIYHEALALEFSDRSIPFKDEVELSIRYKQYLLKKKYKADFVCYDKIVI